MHQPLGNIAATLPAMAAQQPHALAIVVPHGRDRHGKRAYTHLTFAQLDAWSDRIARGLLAQGLRRGERSVLMVKPSLEFFALTFALFKAGIVPVLVDPGLGRAQLKQCIDEAEPQAFIGIPLAHVARVLLGWGRKTVRQLITVGPRLFWGGVTLKQVTEMGGESGDPVLADTRRDDTAAILFTSGSTGPAKGAVYQHGHFLGQVELIRDTYGIEPGEIDLPTFPLFALFDPALGMTAVIPHMDFSRPASVDPQMLSELIADWGVSNVFGSPALLATVVRESQQGGGQMRWPSVRRVLSAGAPVPAAVLEGMARILPEGAEVFTPYGATESLPVASIGSRQVLGQTRGQTESGAGVCVGRVVAPVRVEIIRISDAPIADWQGVTLCEPGEIGEICVHGPTTTQAYYGRPQATTAAKILRDGEVWHRMGDTGYLDRDGLLWYCGRKGHRVETPEGTLHTAPVEEIFNTHPQVRRTALVGLAVGGRVEALLCVEKAAECALSDQQLFGELATLGVGHPTTRGVRRFAVHPGFPVDIRHNAKIGREKLAEWAKGLQPVPGEIPRGAS